MIDSECFETRTQGREKKQSNSPVCPWRDRAARRRPQRCPAICVQSEALESVWTRSSTTRAHLSVRNGLLDERLVLVHHGGGLDQGRVGGSILRRVLLDACRQGPPLASCGPRISPLDKLNSKRVQQKWANLALAQHATGRKFRPRLPLDRPQSLHLFTQPKSHTIQDVALARVKK